MAVFKGFVGGSYSLPSRIAASDECINWYPERIEAQNEKSDMILVGTPGLKVFCTLPTSPVQGVYEVLARVFAVAGGVLYEISANGAYKSRGNLGVSGAGTAIFTSNNVELVVAIAGTLNAWALTLASNILTPISDAMRAAGIIAVGSLAYIDGYVIASSVGTRRFYLSTLYDATSWPGLYFASKEGGADNLVALVANQRVLYLLGAETSEAWWDAGPANFPFAYIQGSFMEKGCAAALSPAQFDNTVAWLGRDKRGQGVVYRANGYTPKRISTHAIESAIGGYPSISDAIGSTHQYRGHEFYRLDFPSAKPAPPNGTSAGATWLYDAATGLWHERAFWQSITPRFEGHRGRYYCSGFGLHLVGDYASGAVYQMDAQYLTDFGNPLRSLRTAPHQFTEGNWQFFNWYRFDLQVGAGTTGIGAGQTPGVAPAFAILQVSNDGGNTWSNERYQSMGSIGRYKRSVIFRRTGRARDRVVRLVISDPVSRVLVGAFYDSTEGLP